MAYELGAAYVSILPSTQGLGKTLIKDFGGAAGTAGTSAGKSAGRSLVGGFAAVATAAAGAVAVGGFIKGAIGAAGNLEQSVGAIDAVFKGSAGQMHSWAASAANDVGLTQNEFNELGTLIGAQLKNGGTAMDQLAPKTNELVNLGADLASMFGGSTASAVEALSSSLKGEMDPVEAYGISLSQAKIDAEAAALGFEKVGSSLSGEAKQAATLSLIMKQTTDAHGNFAKEGNTLAGQQQRMSAGWADIQAAIGTKFLPVMTSAVGLINTHVLPAISGLVAGIDFSGIGAKLAPFADAFGVLFANIGPLIPQVLSLVSSFSPLGMVFQLIAPYLPQIAALLGQIAGVIGGLLAQLLPLAATLMSQIVPVFMQLVSAVLPLVVGVVTTLVSALAPLISQLIGSLAPIIMELAASVFPLVVSAITAVIGAVGPLVNILLATLMPVIEALLPVVSEVFSAIATIVQGAMQVVTGIIQIVTGVISGNWSQVWEGIKNVFQGVWIAIGGILTGAWALIKGVFSAGIGVLVGLWNGLWTGIKQILSGAWAAITSTVSSRIAAVIAFFVGLGSRIIGALSALPGQLVAVGQNIIQGLINGVSGMINNAVQAVKNVGGAMLDGIKGFLGIHSPSRRFRDEVGKMIPKGLAVGVTANAKTAVDAVKKLSDQIAKVGTDAVKKETSRIIEARRAANKKITAANKKLAKGQKKRALLPTLSRAEAEKVAKKNLASAIAGQKAAAKIVAAQGKKTAKLWSKGSGRGTDRLVDSLTRYGNFRKGTSKTVMGSTLTDIAKAREVVASRLEKANDKLGKMLDMRNSIRDAIKGELDLRAGIGQTDAYGYEKPATFASVAGTVKSLAAKAKTFAGKLKALIKAGIPAGLVQEIAGYGTDEGTKVATALLSGSKAQVKDLAADYSSLTKWSTEAGSHVAGQFYGIGINAQQGIIKGLEADDGKLKAAAKKLTSKLTKAVKKELGIKSPSRRFRDEVGKMLPAGIIAGVDAGQSALDRRVAGMVSTPKLGAASSASVAPADRNFTDADLLALASLMESRPIQAQLSVNGRQAGHLVQAGTKAINAYA